MVEILCGYESNPAAPDTDKGNLSSRSSSHLPRINLPICDGRLDKWESFRDGFQSMIIGDSSLKNLERMHYLSSYLTGEASNVLSNLTVINSNFFVGYARLWDMLVDRYENARHLIAVHLRSLFDLPTLTIETVNGFRTIRDQVNRLRPKLFAISSALSINEMTCSFF